MFAVTELSAGQTRWNEPTSHTRSTEAIALRLQGKLSFTAVCHKGAIQMFKLLCINIPVMAASVHIIVDFWCKLLVVWLLLLLSDAQLSINISTLLAAVLLLQQWNSERLWDVANFRHVWDELKCFQLYSLLFGRQASLNSGKLR